MSHKAAGMQVVGMLGLIQTIRRTFGWALRLMFGKIERLAEPPASPIPMRSVDGDTASHAPCGSSSPSSPFVNLHVSARSIPTETPVLQ